MYDVTVGAGNGKRPMNEWDFTELRIPTKILKSMVGRENVPKEVGITKVKGESMYPEVQSGDYVMWTATESVCDGGTYLIRLDGGLLLKVLQRKAGKRLRIHSINSSFSDDFIRQTESGVWVTDDEQEHMVDFEVVGRFLNVIQPKDLFRSTQRLHDVMSAYDKIENGDVPA